MMKRKILTTILIVLLVLTTTVSLADVDPDSVEVLLNPGESYVVDKTVTNPVIPPKLEFLLLEDESGSFSDDIALMQGLLGDYSDGLAAAIWDGLVIEGVEFKGSVSGFIDFAFDGWGGSYTYGNDWVYARYQDMTDEKATWLSGIGQLKTNNGNDWPEAQLGALMSAANGAAWDSNVDGDLTDPEDTTAGENPSWTDGVTKIIVLVTDAGFHVNGDVGYDYSTIPATEVYYPGPTYAATVAALNAEDIHVIILTTSSNLATYADLATDTGGSVKEISDTSSNIVAALMSALEEIRTDVWYEVDAPPELTVTLDPIMYADVLGGSELSFTETISVSDDAEPGEYTATVTFYANTYPYESPEIGTETIKVTVNGAPNCDEAAADIAQLWPPNHKMSEIHIIGVTDPDGDPVTITITGVWQDEPTEGLGDGDFSPDAVIHGDYVEVRAERSGLEDGRVYHIYFTADDGKGGVCECDVTVGVPHDKKDTPVDSGPLYDSLS